MGWASVRMGERVAMDGRVGWVGECYGRAAGMCGRVFCNLFAENMLSYLDTGGATEQAKPSCAGIGDPDKPAWICHHCASHLCSPQPRMPPQALANWNWGGRQHPKYQNLSMAEKTLLGLVKLIMRMVLLNRLTTQTIPRKLSSETQSWLRSLRL